ncbi:cyclic GMP-AMP synthase-like receptor [Diachasmimorpha longicaudata]|uniref:cyclic GMP-AMP synthase-like receptor n=1 Tax=Diachasmimorpha longicaudata TaxID=58733 RepID=UPI0030B8E498
MSGGRDDVLHKVNRFITLQDEQVKKTNPLLREVLSSMMELMKSVDPLFKEMYREPMFAGSFYKGTRVGKPEEFDLDLILDLPVYYNKIEFEDDRPGYARIRVPSSSFKPAWTTHQKILNKWILKPNNYLNNNCLRQWFEGVLAKVFRRLPGNSKGYSILQIGPNRFVQITSKKSGPAFTLLVIHDSGKFDIDLVPVFEFRSRPCLTVFQTVPHTYEPWYLVPKPLNKGNNPELSWRFCFYRYEKAWLSSHGKIKPIIRYLKKLKECQDWSSVLASYYIETLVYHELNAGSFDLHRSSLNGLLLCMLIKLSEACENHYIPYYWDPRNNLIAEKTPAQLASMKNYIKKIIKAVTNSPEDAIIYFLTASERQILAEAGPGLPTTPAPNESEESPSLLSGLINFFRSLLATG